VRQLFPDNSFFLFILILFFICISGCEKKYGNVIDSTGNAPSIKDFSFSVSIINTDTINLVGHPVRSPSDTLTIRGIAQVRIDSSFKDISIVGYSVTNPQFSSSLAEGALHDDGIPPDVNTNDNIYSGYIEFQIQRVVVGTFSINLWSESTPGYKSNTIIVPLQIVRLNHPPVISNLDAPDTVNIAITTSFDISLKVIDPDGQQDIKSVLRFTPSGKILPLYPENDSTNAETVSLVPPPAIGSYIFRFRAVDRSNDTSNTIIKNVVVTN
jgi:hypothetical protein